MALLAMAIHALGVRGALVHRLAGRRDHRPRRTARPGSSTSPRAGSGRRWTRARSRSSPASRASPRTPRTSPRSAAAARTPPRSRWPRRSTPTSARSTPTSTGCSPPTRGSCPNARQLETDHLRGDAGDGRLRREGAAPALRGVRAAVRRPGPRPLVVLAASRAPWSPGRWRTFRWNRRSSPASRTTGARRRSPSSACPTSPAQAARIFRAVAEAEINIDMIVQNVSAGGDRPHRHLLHAAQGRRRRPRWPRCSKVQAEVGFESLLYDDHVGKVSLVGAGHALAPGRRRPGSSARSPTPASTSR